MPVKVLAVMEPVSFCVACTCTTDTADGAADDDATVGAALCGAAVGAAVRG